MLYLSSDQLQQIKSHAAVTYPEECCGILLGTFQPHAEAPLKVLVDVIPTPNAWNETVAAELQPLQPLAASRHPRRDRYWIDPADLLQAQRQGRERGLQMIGIYHSHPDHPAIPSEMDRSLAWITYSYVIVSVQQAEAVDWGCWCLDAGHQFRAEPWQWIGLD